MPQGQHVVTAVARDAAGNTQTSPGLTINLSQMDVQVENGPGNVAGKADSGDTVTFSSAPINPNTVMLGGTAQRRPAVRPGALPDA